MFLAGEKQPSTSSQKAWVRAKKNILSEVLLPNVLALNPEAPGIRLQRQRKT